ncbi:MAG: hypothetical protein K2O17_06845 [Bacteroidaceae bacterium]|nr:hypothetical protein [Bacteroidaceae bacterium]
MKKMFMMAVALIMTTAMNAQDIEKGFSFASEVGIGSELELGVRAQYNFNEYFALDLPVVKYAYDYGVYPVSEITLQAGVRAFSPTFGRDLKAFTALDMGYGNMFDSYDKVHCFAMDCTIGLYVWKGLYVGYGYGAMIKDGERHDDHEVRVGYNFTF